jgi:D-threo-aldose 1-dehydrogenase
VYGDASDEILERARRIEAVCRRYGVPLAAAALQFSLRDDRITSTIAGMTTPEQIGESARLALFPIPDGLWEELEGEGLIGEAADGARPFP